jgi:hypothetical protein
MALDFSRMETAVTRNDTVDGSAVELINSIPQLIREAIAADDVGDATNLNALADRFEASSDRLAAAILANTPQAPGGETGGGETGGGEPTPTPEGGATA